MKLLIEYGMKNKSEISQYESIASEYVGNQREFFSDKTDWTRVKLHKILKEFRNKKILDIGCGAGDDVKWCIENGIEAYGIESSKKMLDIAQKNVQKQDSIYAGSYEEIPFDDGYFDLVMGRFSLHYLKNFDVAYREIFRVLKSNGVLIIIASHPTYDAIKANDVDREGLISVKLYDGKVTVKFPPHGLKDYFSSEFFKHFILQEVDETESVDTDNPLKVPETLFYKCIRK
jgi:ubiquinone/menaquinone biosynthesis C-methylase UbiE